MSFDLVRTVPSSDEIARLEHVANNLAGSGLFKDATAAKQAFAKMMYGRDLGLSPTVAMTALHIVEGKPELSANLQAQLVKSYRGPDGERYDYLVKEHTAEACEIEFRRREPGERWETIGTERFTMDDAKQAGLAQRGPWKTYPRNMLWARCVSNGVNFHCPEVARGLRIYHEGEISGDAPVEQSPAPVVAADPPPTEEIVDAEVVPDPVIEVPAARRELYQLVVDAKTGGVQGLVTMLTAAGATDDRSFGALVASLPADKLEEVQGWLLDAMASGVEVTA